MSNTKRFSFVIIVLIVIVAAVAAFVMSQQVRAATVCSPASAISVPYAKDGVGDVCLQAASLCSYVNSWNLTTLEVNGVAYTNLYVAASSIAPLNGAYTIHYVSSAAYGHFEIAGTCSGSPTSTFTRTPTGGPSLTRSPSPTRTPTNGPTATRTRTPTPGLSNTPTRTATCACLNTNTPTRTVTPTTPPNTPTRTPTATTPIVPPPANPFVGANMYVNHDWKGYTTYNVNTFIWLDSIDAVNGANGYAHSLAGHLDLALAQGANLVGIVLYNIPNRDCAALVSNGELIGATDGLTRYKTEFIDVIYSVISQAKYSGLRIVAVIEPNSLPNLVTNMSYPRCVVVSGAAGGYVQAIQYALNKLHPLSNFYAYVDIGYAGWLGWESNFTPAVTLFANTIKGTTAGSNSVDGFISNTANYAVAVEPFMTANQIIGGNPLRSASFFDWNTYIDEASFGAAWKTAMIAQGMSPRIGMLLDTSRNGWGGCGGSAYVSQPCRPTSASASTDVNIFVNAGRIDRRPSKGNWCNQNGAGIGALPQANPGNGYDAYVWVKAPGESDGSSSLMPIGSDNPRGYVFDSMCDPNYMGNMFNSNRNSNALPNAPVYGAWFQAQFDQLVANKYP